MQLRRSPSSQEVRRGSCFRGEQQGLRVQGEGERQVQTAERAQFHVLMGHLPLRGRGDERIRRFPPNQLARMLP